MRAALAQRHATCPTCRIKVTSINEEPLHAANTTDGFGKTGMDLVLAARAGNSARVRELLARLNFYRDRVENVLLRRLLQMVLDLYPGCALSEAVANGHLEGGTPARS